MSETWQVQYNTRRLQSANGFILPANAACILGFLLLVIFSLSALGGVSRHAPKVDPSRQRSSENRRLPAQLPKL